LTISSTTRIAGPFVGNGTASVFPFTFKVFAAADLDVIRLATSTGVETTLVLNSDYTVSLNGNQNTNPGGSVTLSAGALASGFTLTITSDIANLQPTDLTNQGGFYPEVITDSLDRATIQIQQMADDLTRSIKTPISDGLSLNMELPTAAVRANSFLAFDSTGEPTVVTAGSSGAPATITRQVFSGTGSQTVFTLASDPGALGNSAQVYIGGVYQQRSTYTIAGTTLTFSAAPVAGTDNIEFVNFLTSNIGSTSADLVTYTPAGSGAVARSAASKFGDVDSVKDFGAVGDGVADDTAAIQAAMNAAAGSQLYFEKPTTKYLVGELTVPSNSMLVFDAGTILESNATLLPGTKKLLNIGGSNVQIHGYGATLQMVKAGFSSEYNHCVSIISATGTIIINGLACNDSGGDGFYVKSPSADVVFNDCRANNNRRQGLSIVECRSFTDHSGVYSGTTGTAPSCGVDIEPNGTADVLGPIRFYGTTASDNDASGFLVFLNNWLDVDNVADIAFVACVSDSNAQSTSASLNRMAGFEVRRISSSAPPRGRVTFTDCSSINDGYAGFRVTEKDVNGPQIELIRPLVYAANRNASSTSGEDAGISLYNNGVYTTTPGAVRVISPTVVQKTSGNMVYAVHVTSNGGGHRRCSIADPIASGTYSAASAIFIGADEQSVIVDYAYPTFTAFSTNATLTDGRYLGQILTNASATATITFTLPTANSARIGWRFTIAVVANYTINISPQASDRIYPYGTGVGDAITSSVQGSRITLECVAANTWMVVSESGTWA
jgi:hypothetical protein